MRVYASCSIAFVALLAFTVACGSAAHTPSPTAQGTIARLSGSITVFAASSLTDAFNDEKAAFETANTGISVTLNFAGSPTLRTQLDQGARADVLATADQQNMDAALQSKLVSDGGRTLAQNKLAVIVPRDNPANITSPFDLARPGVKLDLAQEGVPAGDYARQIIRTMEADPREGAGFADKVLENVVSNEANVKAVVAKVQLGEADAGIVYATDVTPDLAADVTLLPIPNDLNVLATYPIAITSNAQQPRIAQAFIDFVLSVAGQEIMQSHGFLPAQ